MKKKIDRDTCSRQMEDNSEYSQSDTILERSSSADSNRKNKLFSTSVRTKRKMTHQQNITKFGCGETKSTLENIERVVRNRSSTSSDDEIIQKLKYKQRNAAKELKESKNVSADSKNSSNRVANIDSHNYPSSRRRKISPEYTRVSSTSFIKNYIPAVCEPPVAASTLPSSHQGARVNHAECALNENTSRHRSIKTHKKTVTATSEKSSKTVSSKSKDEKRHDKRMRKSSSVEKRSPEKSSGYNFYGRHRTKRDNSLERRIEMNKESSRRLMKTEYLRGENKNRSPERKREKKSNHERVRKSSSPHRRKNGGSASASRKNERKTRKKSKSKEAHGKRSRSISTSSDELKSSEVYLKKIQPRELVKKKRKRGAKDSEDDDEPTFKSKKITLTVLPEKNPTLSSMTSQNMENEKPEVQKVSSPSHKTEWDKNQNNTKSSKVKSEIRSPVQSENPVTEFCVEKNEISADSEEKSDIKTEEIGGATENCADEKSTLRERLKPLLEKKNLNPIQLEVPFKSVKIDVKPETSAVLNSVPTSSASEKDRKPLSISIKSSTGTSIKKNLALSNFLSTARKEMMTSKPEIIMPPEEKHFTKEGKVSEDENSSSDGETRGPVVYQGCANIAKDDDNEEPSGPTIGSLSFVLNSLKPPTSASCPDDVSDKRSKPLFLDKEQPDKVAITETDSTQEVITDRLPLPSCFTSGQDDLKMEGVRNHEKGEETENEEIQYNGDQEEVEDDVSDGREVEDIVYYCSQAQEFLKSGLTEDVVLELDQLYADGFLADPLAHDVIENLNKLSEELSLFILQQFRESDFSKVRNNGLFFKGKVKLALMKGDSLLNGSTNRAIPAKEIALQKAKLFSSKDVNSQNEYVSICSSKLSSVEPVAVNPVPQQSLSNLPSSEPGNSQVKNVPEIGPKFEFSESSSASALNFHNPESTVDVSTESKQNTDKAYLQSNEKVVPSETLEADITDDVLQPQQCVKSRSDTFGDKDPSNSVDNTSEVKSASKGTTDMSLLAEESPKVSAVSSTAPFAKLGSKVAIALKPKPELTELREKKAGSTREKAQKFNDEVAVLNQILFCGAGPSNYVPHQEGQYTPTKVNPDYHKLQHIIQVTQYHFDDVSNPFVRCFGPPLDWDGAPPGQDCKLFVGKLPCDIFEDDLIPVFFEAGNVYEVRILVDEVTGLNKGFCFVTMCTRIETNRAIKLLHGRLIKPRHKIIVRREVKFNQLFIGNLPTDKTEDQIAKEFSKIYNGIIEIDLVYKGKDCGNSGFCIITFESFEATRDVRDIIQANPIAIEDWDSYREYCADWAIPNEVLHDKKQESSSSILIKHLKLNTSEQELREHFSSYGKILKVIVQSYHAYIVFESNKEAAAAVMQLTAKGLHAKVTEQDPGKIVLICLLSYRLRIFILYCFELRSSAFPCLFVHNQQFFELWRCLFMGIKFVIVIMF